MVIRTPAASRITINPDSVTDVDVSSIPALSGVPVLDRCVQVVLLRDSDPGSPVTILDTVHQTYRPIQTKWTIMNFIDHSGGLRMSKIPPGSSVSDLAFSIDSIGDGPILHGHHTVHYRQTRRGTLTMALGPTTVKILNNDTLDIYIATDIRDPQLSIGHLPFTQMLDFPGEISALDSAVQTAARKYPLGLPLRFEKRLVMVTSLGDAPATSSFSLDVDTWNHGPVDAALLTVPASYTGRTP